MAHLKEKQQQRIGLIWFPSLSLFADGVINKDYCYKLFMETIKYYYLLLFFLRLMLCSLTITKRVNNITDIDINE